MLQQGNMELYGSDSLIVNSCLSTNLHRYGEFDSRLNVNSDKIYLSRVKKTTNTPRITGYDSINLNRLIEIKNLYFQPDLEEIVWTEETKGSLDNLARELQIYFARNEDIILLIHGHIDLGGDEVLSIFRAETVREELVQRGVKATIFCVGHGSSQRKSALRGDRRNRRVEIEVLACDSCFNQKDYELTLGEDTKLDLIKDLPDEYIINAQFKLTPEGKFFIVMNPGSGMEELRWEIPNIAGGEMQALRIKKRYKIEEDAIMLEFYLDDVRVLTQSITGYETFGFDVKKGTLNIVNLNIMGPDQ